MTALHLRLEAQPGGDIADCCDTAQDIADELGVVVVFEFNGVLCHAQPGSLASALEKNYHAALSVQPSPKQAWS